MTLRTLVCLGSSICLAATALLAQQPTPAFEVASVKANNAGGRGTTMGTQAGRYTATNVTMRALVLNAYRLQSVQLAGGPNWLGSDHFDIVAKMPTGVPDLPPSDGPTPLESMLWGLLAERFKFVAHTESRQLAIYALVPARRDQRLGPQLRRTTSDCAAQAGPSTMKEKEGKGKTKEESPSAAVGRKSSCRVVMGSGRLSGSAMSLPMLARSLTGAVERTVLDRTGIAGAFDVELTWTPDQMPQVPVDPAKSKGVKIDPNGPSIFTALQEQLGLKLQSGKGPVKVLVIDHIERPTPN